MEKLIYATQPDSERNFERWIWVVEESGEPQVRHEWVIHAATEGGKEAVQRTELIDWQRFLTGEHNQRAKNKLQDMLNDPHRK